jgi:hypothetical protein
MGQGSNARTLSAVLFCRTVMLAVPTSPLVLNLTPSLVALICTAGHTQHTRAASSMGWQWQSLRGKSHGVLQEHVELPVQVCTP